MASPSRTRLVRPLLALAGISLLAAGAAAPATQSGTPRPGVIHPILEGGFLERVPEGRGLFQSMRADGRIPVRIVTREPETLRREARRLGAEIRAERGGVASIDLPAGAIRALARLPGVVAVRPANAYRPVLDVSTVEAEAPLAASAYGGTGAGVIVAVIDSGIDFRHEDFRDANGASRILAAWDQSETGGGGFGCGPGYTFGRCYTKADLDADLSGGTPVALRDGSTPHGTHVAGIAAGNGLGTANGVPAGTYRGVAPEADLLVVRVFNTAGAFVGDLTAAYAWVEDQAATFGKPFVINLSLGGDLGPHDGTDPDEISLDALLAPGLTGRAAAIASGNSRGSGIHVQATASPGATIDHAFTIPSYTPLAGSDNDFLAIDLWYEGGDSLTVSVLDPNGVVLANAPRGASSGLLCTPYGAMVLDATNTTDPLNADSEVFFFMADDSRCAPVVPPSAGAVLKLRVSGVSAPHGGRYHAWSDTALGANPPSLRFAIPDETTIAGAPATAFRAAAAGSYVTRDCWPNADPNSSGTSCLSISAPTGALSGFSSNGPTRDGRSKPDVAAPGEWIVSTLASTLPLPLSQRSADGMHWRLRGTSMAAPHVAGALAILFQLNPGLDAAQARDLLAQGARSDPFTGPVPNTLYGAGKLDVAESAAALLRLVGDVAASAAGVFAWPPEAHSDAYNVYRGDLPGSLPASYGTCLLTGLTAPSFSDPGVPAPGHGFFYLVTGERAGLEGSLGFTGDGLLRPNLAPCP